MDKQNRLTAWDEWEIGECYDWVKGSMVMGDYICMEVNQRGGYVSLNGIRQFNWQRRYRKQNLPANDCGDTQTCDQIAREGLT